MLRRSPGSTVTPPMVIGSFLARVGFPDKLVPG